ncbi:unnamed protein product [Anisakis simplex]|uniref:Uncharacterized protein n=1 Tax=Anisakis simplex TaxID=6269 RepID=A0A3P6PH88_ANISI|nr:unnamed protein product [Anisakis simplex]
MDKMDNKVVQEIQVQLVLLEAAITAHQLVSHPVTNHFNDSRSLFRFSDPFSTNDHNDIFLASLFFLFTSVFSESFVLKYLQKNLLKVS